MKKLLLKQSGDLPHWVGDGFPVRTVFSYNQNPAAWSPFLLMDHAGPTEFEPSEHIRGVGEHPHRGFETVTIVYEGEVEHRDSAGGGGAIGPGDVQWMTAARGLVHEEKHGRGFAKRGGPFEMIQLWVNLPAKDKMSAPKYQTIASAAIPRVDLDGAGYARVIAGELRGQRGPARTFTPIDLWDVRLTAGKPATFALPVGHTANVFVLSGTLRLDGGETLAAGELGVFDREAAALTLTATTGAKVLVLSGAPINEPVVGYGPFVMNTGQEIRQAIEDYQAGRMGHLKAR
jgi:redox-sensitive bicupin YhaK (pirin superfamily)